MMTVIMSIIITAFRLHDLQPHNIRAHWHKLKLQTQWLFSSYIKLFIIAQERRSYSLDASLTFLRNVQQSWWIREPAFNSAQLLWSITDENDSPHSIISKCEFKTMWNATQGLLGTLLSDISNETIWIGSVREAIWFTEMNRTSKWYFREWEKEGGGEINYLLLWAWR